MSIAVLTLSTLARAYDYTGDGIDDLLVGIPFEQDIGGVGRPGAIDMLRGSSLGLSSRGGLWIDQETARVPGTASEDEIFGYAIAAGDVDGNGRDDIIVSAPKNFVSGAACGTVWRLELGTVSGVLGVETAQQFSQATPGVSDTAEASDLFGGALVVDDFNGDGFDDVVVGIPNEGFGTVVEIGAVEYLPGSATGLTTSGETLYDQDTPGALGDGESGDGYGGALASGDFDADGYADLAIGIPYEDRTGFHEGTVHVMYGASSGPGLSDDGLWAPGAGTAEGTSNDAAVCGSALAVGDFDSDGYDDLAIGCPGYDIGRATAAGAVLLIYGSAAGLDESEIWSQEPTTVLGSPETGDNFGLVLTTGDFNGDHYDDLAIGAPYESWDGYTENGAVQVLMGSSSGITDAGDVLLAQGIRGVAGTAQSYQYWGLALASGDYDDDGVDDLVVGSPYDYDGGNSGAGVINVLYGSSSGPSVSGDDMYDQDTSGIADSVEGGDYFGWTLR